jgi:hypothetical protein
LGSLVAVRPDPGLVDDSITVNDRTWKERAHEADHQLDLRLGRKTYAGVMGPGDTITLAYPSRVVQGDRGTHLLYEVDGTTKGGV